MKITDLQVDGFGVWNELTVDDLSSEMTVFFGRNEAGKTTLMQFIRSVLYGFEPERRQRYLPPVFGGLGGGSLFVHNGDLRLQVQRLARPESDPTAGDLAVLSSQGHQYGTDYLERLLAGVDESIYNNVFAIGLHEIQELAGLDGTEAARELYKLASGVDRVSLIDVMSELERRRKELLEGVAPAPAAPTRSSGRAAEKPGDVEAFGRIAQLVRRRRDLRKRLDGGVHSGRQWVALIEQRRDLERQVRERKDELSSLEQQSRVLELAIRIEPTVRRLRAVEEELDALSRLPDERDVDVEKLQKLQQRLQEYDRQLDQVGAEAEGVKRSADRLPLNRNLWKQASRIEALGEHQTLIGSLGRQAERLREESRRLEEELEEFGAAKDAGRIDRATLAKLAGPAKAVRSRRRDLEHAERDLAAAEEEVARQRTMLDDAMVSHDCESLGDSFHEAGQLVHLLKKRQGIDERIDRLTQQRKSSEADLDEAIQNQVFSPERLFVVGGFVVVGVALVLGGWSPFLVRWLEPNPLLGFFGCAVVLAGLGLKKYWEYEAQDQVDRAKQVFDRANDEIAKAKQERDDLDRTLPAGLGQVDGRLNEAQRRLSVLEKLLPLDGRVAEAAGHRDRVRDRVEQARAEVKRADERWRESLRAFGLAADLSPVQVRQLSERSGQIEATRQRLQDTRRQLEQYDEDLDAIRLRVITVHEDLGLELDSDDTLDMLKQLEAELRGQRTLMEQRQEFARQYRELRERRTKVHRRLQRLKLLRTQLLSKVGAANETEFRGLAEKHRIRRERLAEVESLQGKIRTVLAEQVDRDAVVAAVDRDSAPRLEAEWETLGKKIDEVKREQERLHEVRGELSQQIKQQGESDDLERARLELSEIEGAIDEAIGDWQELAATGRILESLREFYEAHRQPETLKNASKYLAKMTGGRYVRLWTRMVGNALLVDGPEDEGLSIEVLSRGTREAVFLALRLSLVDAYRRRGIRLPMVLDDVLVNFDAERARLAGEVLRDFAQQGHQLLMFTCHAHMSELFDGLGCDVRVLPYHRDVVHRAATVVTKADDHVILEELDDEPPTVSQTAIEQIEELEQTLEEALTEEQVEPEPEPEPEPVVELPKRRKKKRRPRPEPEVIEEPVLEEPIEPEPEPEAVTTARQRNRWDAPGLWFQEESLD
ncbi:MAG TPA: AAA family ATPase [Pirellulaceae bacterium]|nr:AAA family ATPase [Pirellulaceae bacterium]